MKISTHNIKNINQFRKEEGLKELRLKKVTCMSCGKDFQTYHRFNRICEKCKNLHAQHSSSLHHFII